MILIAVITIFALAKSINGTIQFTRMIKESGINNKDLTDIEKSLSKFGESNQIQNIKKVNDSEYMIETGYNCGFLCGQGKFYQVTKNKGIWEVKFIGNWSS